MNPAQFIAHFIDTAIVTAIVSAIVLWRYKVGVLAGMNVGGAVELPLPVFAARPLRLQSTSPSLVLGWEKQARRRVALVVSGAVLVASLPLAYMAAAAIDRWTPTDVVAMTGQFVLAAVPITALLLAFSWRRALVFAVVLLSAVAALVIAVSMVQRVATGRWPSIDQLLNGVLFFQLTAVSAVSVVAPLPLLLATVWPRVRGVAPMTFVGLLVFSLAPLGGSQLTRALAMTRGGGELVLNVGLMTGFVILALPTAWLAWRALRAVARAFDTKRIADSELLSNVWWVMFVAVFAIENLNARGWSWQLLGLATVSWVSFAVMYRFLLHWALPVPRPERRTLLLLRVFGDASRTERLFDRVAARWRWLGPVTMIAAPDVVARTVDPGDFLEFATGRLQARFVKTAGDLDSRLATLDDAPDPDGRFRVNELCCQADTWRATVVGLIDRADAVLMDLREFSAKRAGCAFELQQLGQRLEAGRLVLTVDDTTDRDFLLANLGGGVKPRIVKLPARRVSNRDLDRVFEEVTSAAY